jgi:hypothetical protein
MFKIMLALHLLTAIFAIGPLVGAATTASRGLRRGDAAATDAAARTLTIYSYASVAVVLFGFGLMSSKAPWGHGRHVAEMGDPFIWISLALWIVSLGLILGLVVPSLQQATATIGKGGSAGGAVGKVAALGGVVGLIYAVIVFLMVYKPGS